MKIIFLLFVVFCNISSIGNAQSVGIGTNSPNPNAKLDIADTTRGILIPRMDSTHRKNIPNTEGLMVYDLTTTSFWYNDGAIWHNINGVTGLPSGSSPTYAIITGSNYVIPADGNSANLLNIPGLTFAAAANTTYEFEAVLSILSVSEGFKFGVNYSTSGANVEGQMVGNDAGQASASTYRISAFNTGYGTPLFRYDGTGGIIFKGVLVTGANTGNFTIMAQMGTTFVTGTVYSNSYLKVTKIQ